jgi:hypothetical protein
MARFMGTQRVALFVAEGVHQVHVWSVAFYILHCKHAFDWRSQSPAHRECLPVLANAPAVHNSSLRRHAMRAPFYFVCCQERICQQLMVSLPTVTTSVRCCAWLQVDAAFDYLLKSAEVDLPDVR